MILYTGIRAISGLQFKGYPGKNRNHGVSEITIVVARVPVGTYGMSQRYVFSFRISLKVTGPQGSAY